MIRDEVAAAHAKRDFLLSNYVEEEGPLATPCWIWQRACNSHGYGHLGLDHFHYLAHRLMWILVNGPVPDELWVLHKCDEKICVNPDHLFLGDPQTNVDDMWAKGRANPTPVIGSQHGNTSLIEDKIAAIRHRVDQGKSYGLVASEFGISSQVVGQIARGDSWAHVDGPLQKRRERPKQSQFIGVRPHRSGWQAYARAYGRHVHLGQFTSEAEAALAYNSFVCDQWLPKPLNVIPGIHD
jgi:hypothetical protein